ncbi:MAG TPA: phospholipase A [Candidatus Krumholzibacteria bacterium]|nr:phospholipase A [Candidatus Krumholzibacteria bacterium]
MVRLFLTIAVLVFSVPARPASVSFDAAGDPADRSAKFRLHVDLPVLRVQHTTVGAVYGQRSFWDVDDDDDPFRVETNFRPEVYLQTSAASWRWRGSYVHESNGLEQGLSRGWNRVVLTVERRSGSWRVTAAAWIGFRVEDTNPDLRRTVGDGEIHLRGDEQSFLAPAFRARWSLDPVDDSPVTSIRAALRLPLPHRVVPDRRVRFLVEVFWGRGEMLHDDARITRALRLGVTLDR